MTDTHTPEFGLEIVMRAAQSHRRELLQTLERLHETVDGEARVTACEVLEDSIVPNRFYWVERWLSADDVRASLESDRIAILMAAIRLLGSVEAVRRTRLMDPPGVTPT